MATNHKVIAVYDNGGVTVDRYTVVFNQESVDHIDIVVHSCLNLSEHQSHPNGVSCWGDFHADILALDNDETVRIGIGERKDFIELPYEVQKHVRLRVESDAKDILFY